MSACLRMSFGAMLLFTVYNGYCAREMLSELFGHVFMFKCERESRQKSESEREK